MRDELMQTMMQETQTIAVVGLSKKPFRAGFYVPEYLQAQGYRIIPVNPFLKEEVLSEKPYPNLIEIPDPVDMVLLFQRSENVPPFVDEAIEIGSKFIWMQLGIEHPSAAEKAEAAGLKVVQNACMLVEHRRLKR